MDVTCSSVDSSVDADCHDYGTFFDSCYTPSCAAMADEFDCDCSGFDENTGTGDFFCTSEDCYPHYEGETPHCQKSMLTYADVKGPSDYNYTSVDVVLGATTYCRVGRSGCEACVCTVGNAICPIENETEEAFIDVFCPSGDYYVDDNCGGFRLYFEKFNCSAPEASPESSFLSPDVQTESSHSKTISTGALVGIVLVAACCVGIGLFAYYRKGRRPRENPSKAAPVPIAVAVEVLPLVHQLPAVKQHVRIEI